MSSIAIVRKIYGPFAFEEKGLRGYTSHELRWYFFGIRGDGEMSHWVLVYEVNLRKFRASHTGTESPIIGARNRKALHDQGIAHDKAPSIHHRMFIENDDTPTQEGRITDILRNRLKPEDFAKAVAASIA